MTHLAQRTSRSIAQIELIRLVEEDRAVKHVNESILLCEEGAELSTFRSDDECAICLTELTDIESGRLAFVAHSRASDVYHPFHEPCIRAVLRTNKNCPLCRDTITALLFATTLNRTQADQRSWRLTSKVDRHFVITETQAIDPVVTPQIRSAMSIYINLMLFGGYLGSLSIEAFARLTKIDVNTENFGYIGFGIGFILSGALLKAMVMVRNMD